MSAVDLLVGKEVHFNFSLHRVSMCDPIKYRTGHGVVIDTGRTHDNYCDASAVRLRVTGGPSYAVGEIVQCSVFDLILRGLA